MNHRAFRPAASNEVARPTARWSNHIAPRSDPALAPPRPHLRRAVAGGYRADLNRDPVLSTERLEKACIVRLGGEIDLYNAPAVREALLAACSEGPERVVVDLSEVEFLDSTALGALVEARTRLPNREGFILA